MIPLMTIDYTEGDEIICVKSHSQGVVKAGQIFTALAIKKNGCGCILYVDIGIQTDRPLSTCPVCRKSQWKDDSIWWIDARLFRRLLSKSEEEDFYDAISEKITSI